jgi:hypothetical protein
MEPIIAASARKHGVADEDMLHAYANPIRFYAVDEGLQMLIGPDLVQIGRRVFSRSGPSRGTWRP